MKPLFQGELVVCVDEGKFVARHDWLLSCGAVWFEMDDADAPELALAWWLPGGPDSSQVSAYLFHEGQRVLSTENSAQGYVEFFAVCVPATMRRLSAHALWPALSKLKPGLMSNMRTWRVGRCWPNNRAGMSSRSRSIKAGARPAVCGRPQWSNYG